MALYHASIKIASKDDGNGMRASAHFAYLCRIGAFEKLRTDEELVCVESGNMPSWAIHDPSIFWLASDTYERAKGSVYRELEAALPRELSPEQQRAMVQEFIDQVLHGHPYTLAIHIKKASDGLAQPHIHLMWSERLMDGIERDPVKFFKRAAAGRKGKNGNIKAAIDPGAGGCRKIGMHPRIDDFRALWATLTNEAYAAAGSDLRVSHLSLADQGIERDAERHLGPVRMKGTEGMTLLERRAARKQAEAAEAEALAVMEEFAMLRVKQAEIQKLFKTPISKKNRRHELPVTDAIAALDSVRLNDRDRRQWPRREPKPRAHSLDILRATEHRTKMLILRYGAASPMLAQFWRIRTVPSRREIIYEQQGGASRIVDKGGLITADHGNKNEIDAMVELARIKAWRSIVFSGNDEFKLLAMVSGLIARLDVATTNESDAKLLERARVIVGGGGPTHRRPTI